MLISVIVSTYNNYDALSALLRSLALQNDTGFEVIIADDGSVEECRKLTTRYANRQPYQCRHIWHENLVRICMLLMALTKHSIVGDLKILNV